jgi:uncharacterized membrane protein
MECRPTADSTAPEHTANELSTVGAVGRINRHLGVVRASTDGQALVAKPGRPEVASSMPKLDRKVLHHPVVVTQSEKRASDVQLRIADMITSFAGSMNFVYVHVAVFAIWILVFEKSPWPTLTLIVSLESIFLSTFVMIGQNRQGAFEQAQADHDYGDVNSILIENTELTRAIHQLTEALHEHFILRHPEENAAPLSPATEPITPDGD